MNHTVKEGLKFATRIQKDLPSEGQVEVVLCPPFTSLYSLSVALSEKPTVKLGAQNCHWEEKGAFTGEIGAAFLKELNCEYVIVGHSERRQLFHETDKEVCKKIAAVFANEMTPIFCIGETEDQRDKGKTAEVIERQLGEGLKEVFASSAPALVIAYEPVWAIGTGKNATPEQAQEVHEAIRRWFVRHFTASAAGQMRILYGGSVKPDNTAVLMKKPDIDGVLVGGASLEVDSFARIVNYT
ncbi:MAG: triose-phosphate isomerase [Deltaproteobacteria bacterium]|nr:triose-phosphate isomerase [Deltaproteobacteria bacterium]